MEKKKKEFYNRKKELDFLSNKYHEIDKTGRGVMIALYGRRRVGKTELIKKFSEQIRGDKLYFYIGLGERQIIFNSLAETIKEQLKETIRISSADNFYSYLSKKSEQKKVVIVLDEFQRFLDIAPEFISSLQNHWDSTLKEQKIMVLLVGSSIGMIQKITNSRAGALYGRTQKIKISPFRYYDFRLMFKELSEEEKITRYSVFGGTPFYLEKTKRFKDTFEAINEIVLKKDSELSEEPKTLLEYENVKVHAKYNSILQAISSGKEVLKEIQDFTKLSSTHIPPYMGRLDNLLDLVKRNDPVLGKERLGRYKIQDNFFRFWYRYIFQNETAINLENIRFVLDIIKKDINSYVGKIFEEIVKELLIRYNTKKIKELKLNFENIGSWWDRNGNEIDIVAYNLKEKEFLLGEVKWTSKKMDLDIIEELEEKAKYLHYNGLYKFIFVSKSGFTDKAIEKMDMLNATYLDLNDVERLFDNAEKLNGELAR